MFKGTPANGASIGGQNLCFLRNRAVQNFYDVERNNQVNPVPGGQGGQQALSAYVINNILPNALNNIQNENPIFTEAKAVEQIMAQVVANQFNWVPAAVFQPNGAAVQPTQHF